MSERMRAGVIGLGFLGSAYAGFFHKHPGMEVVAVADIRPEVAERVAGEVGAEAHRDYDEMLRRHALDLVAVATPDPFHRGPTVAALEAGVKAIILEKPFATTLEDALAIYEAVERHKARLYVNYANRADPLDVASHYVMQSGLLGRVVYGEVRLDDNISVPTGLWGANSRAWAAGSSTAHFLLSHVVDLLRWYLAPAEVREVYAISRREVLGDTPDLYDAFLTFDSGLVVRAKAEWIKHMDELVEFYLCFSGHEGTLVYNKLPGFGTTPGWRANVAIGTTAEELLAHQRALGERGVNVAVTLGPRKPGGIPLTARDAASAPALEYRGPKDGGGMALVGAFLDSLREGTLTPTSWQDRGPLPTHVDGLRQTQVTCAIVESAQTGKVVRVA